MGLEELIPRMKAAASRHRAAPCTARPEQATRLEEARNGGWWPSAAASGGGWGRPAAARGGSRRLGAARGGSACRSLSLLLLVDAAPYDGRDERASDVVATALQLAARQRVGHRQQAADRGDSGAHRANLIGYTQKSRLERARC